MAAGARRMTAKVACSADARCSVARTSASHRGFHTDLQKNFLCLPHYYSYWFPCSMQLCRRSAFRFQYSSRRGIQSQSWYVLQLSPAKPGSAALTAADAMPAAETIAGVMCSEFPQNAASRRCELSMERPPAHWPTNWHAWARLADCPSSCEPKLTARAKPLQPRCDRRRSFPHPPSRPLVRYADR